MATVKKSVKKTTVVKEAVKEAVKKEDVVLSTMEKKILEKTEIWASELGYKGYEGIKSTKSEKVKAIEACLMKNDFAGKQGSLAKIISVMIDEKITIKDARNFYEKGIMVVPLAQTNGHNYDLGEPVLIVNVSNQMALKANGNIGNSLPVDKKQIRPATAEEVRKYFETSVE